MDINLIFRNDFNSRITGIIVYRACHDRIKLSINIYIPACMNSHCWPIVYTLRHDSLSIRVKIQCSNIQFYLSKKSMNCLPRLI